VIAAKSARATRTAFDSPPKPCIWFTRWRKIIKDSRRVAVTQQSRRQVRSAQDEQADIRRLKQRVAKLLTQAAMEEFPALKQMTAPQIRAFGDKVTRTATDFAMQAAHLAYEAEEGR
jgi:hypothetical protein